MLCLHSLPREHLAHHIAESPRISHYDRSLPAQRLSRRSDEFHNSMRKNREKRRLARKETPFVFGVKTVDIFVDMHSVDNSFGIDMRRKRHLDKNTMDRTVSVERIDSLLNIGLHRVFQE